MRRGVGADFPHRGQLARLVVQSRGAPQRGFAPSPACAHNRTKIARFFLDLRGVLCLSPHQAAVHVMTRTETIDALESGNVEYLPPWPETARIVMAYAAMAGIDGRPALSVIAEQLHEVASMTTAARAAPGRMAHQPRLPVDQLRRAGTAIANGAKRLPKDALQQVRDRPERAFYAVSLPLGVLLLALNTSVLSHVAGPVVRMASSVTQVLRVQFAPIREGHRWIDVDDPRTRRADKLRIGER